MVQITVRSLQQGLVRGSRSSSALLGDLGSLSGSRGVLVANKFSFQQKVSSSAKVSVSFAGLGSQEASQKLDGSPNPRFTSEETHITASIWLLLL
ncbi:hypothetical protein EYF80_027925 [Liparis tanakae]|uniref:Uncharacterized protein n=1 Tax=Liparis tanakae TaxID=230148 RepID=A0A4Z2H798_9TELE|nr:hypothetical protein EYF80_027925 [Liparis tanakae]